MVHNRSEAREEVRKTNELKKARIEAGLSLRGLSEKSGVAVDTISRIESGQRVPQTKTLNKLSDALNISVARLAPLAMRDGKPVEKTKTTREGMEKAEVTVWWRDSEDRVRGETLRFYGEEIDFYEHGDERYTLYECPEGYRVFVEDIADETAILKPFVGDYTTYSAEEVVEEFPVFGEAVGIFPVRDLD